MNVLTAIAVQELALRCRPVAEGKNIEVEGISATFRLSRARLEQHRAAIDELLAQLPHEFRAKGYGPAAGGGWTFLNACVRADGYHWGEQYYVELLLALGLAIGSVAWSLPPELWDYLPGKMPYFHINPPPQ